MHLRQLETFFRLNSDLSQKFIVILISLCLLASIVSITFSAYMIIIVLLFISVIIVSFLFKIHVFQLLMLLVVFGAIFLTNLRTMYLLTYNIFFGLLILYYFIVFCYLKDIPKKLSPYHIIGLTYILFGIIALLSVIVNTRFVSSSILETIRMFSLFPLFMFIFYIIGEEVLLKMIIYTLFFISFSLAAYSYILMFQLGIKGFLVQGITALHGLSAGSANPNSMAMFLGFAMPILLSYIFYGERKTWKIYSFIGLIFLFIIWLLWNSRSSYVYFFVSAVVLMSYHRKRLMFLLSMFFIVIIGIFLVYEFPVFQDLLRLESGLSMRDDLWMGAINIIKENPIWGTGPSSYEDVKYYYMLPSAGKYFTATGMSGAAHNLMLTLTSEMGIFASLLLIFYFIFIVINSIRAERKMRSSNLYYLYIGCVSAFIGLIARSIFESGGIISDARLGEVLIPMLFIAIIFKLPQLQKVKTQNISNKNLPPSMSLAKKS